MAVQNFGSGGGGFQISPGINVSEIDLTTVVPPTATTVGAVAGVFRWGPVGVRQLVSSENDLVKQFGRPTTINPETFFTAANFLSYSNALYVSRAANTSVVFSAIANSTAFAANAAHTISNRDDYDAKVGSFSGDVEYIARCPGALGNSLKISVCDTANAFAKTFDLRSANVTGTTNTSFNNANTKIALSVGSNTATITIANSVPLTGDTPVPFANTVAALFTVGDYIEVGNSSIGKQALKITSVGSVLVANATGTNTGYASFTLTLDQPLKLSTDIDANTVIRNWEYFNQVDRAPGQSVYMTSAGNTAASDELHVVIVDEDGGFTGNPGAVLEVYKGLSRATDAKNADGSTNYYKNVLNEQSQYVWWASDRSNAVSNTAVNVASSTNEKPLTLSFQGGVDNDEASVPLADLARAYDLYASAEEVDIALVLTGTARGGTHGEQLPNYLIDNIAEVRKDCVVFVSPQKADVVNQVGVAADNVVQFRNAVRSSSFAVMDSGYKYQYDKYNDIYRYVPLNGDIAGLCVVTDNVRDPWYSPAGYNRGQIRNVVKLPFNPSKAERDLLYKNGVNPVITQQGQGTLLFGDKTLLAKPSAFDRINVRRLFIVLEKAISNAAKSMLFEFNDEFTRTQFRNLVEPFLRDVQGRRGIFDYKVICDETNNTAEVIDSNRFVGDIYVKPARSINYIQLNFVAVRSGIEFSEIVG
jgi:Phage tail sheath protein subtilisin-like domain/Phage tail sheath C-terminal domain